MDRDVLMPPLLTNTFALCQVVSLEWHVYSLSPLLDTSKSKKPSTLPSRVETTALTVFFHRMKQRNAICSLVDAFSANDPASVNLWVFIVNGVQSGVPVEPPTGVLETQTGSWTRLDGSLACIIQTHLFSTLSSILTCQLLSQDEFKRTKDEFFALNAASFMARGASFTDLTHKHMYLDETVPTPAFQLSFALIEPSHLLTVAVAIVRTEGGIPSKCTTRAFNCTTTGYELGDPRCSYDRLVGLPSQKDHSMVDVWHETNTLIPRILAGTKYTDVVPWFRAVSKRRAKRNVENNDGTSGNEDEEKKDEQEDEGEDEDDETHETEGETDELLRRPVTGSAAKLTRKRENPETTDMDESLRPVSPDTHVNTPKAAGPITRLTLPHDDELEVQGDADVKHFQRRRRAKKKKMNEEKELVLALGQRSALDATAHQSMTESKPLRVAVSLVESLSRTEQQEELDGRPVRTHPLLQALEDSVENEAKRTMVRDATLSRQVKLVPNAAAFVPPPIRATVDRLSINQATANQLRLLLCSERFQPWQMKYTSFIGSKTSRKQKKEQQRRVLLTFDAMAFERRAQDEAQEKWKQLDDAKTRETELTLGLQVAASDALVTWRYVPHRVNLWAVHANLNVRSATASEKSEMVARVAPYLDTLTLLLKKEATTELEATKSRHWMSVDEYMKAMTKTGATRIECVRVPEEPRVCVSTLDASHYVAPALLSEYLVRDFHPVAAPKPLDYVIVCPQSPSQWLASLALSYCTCFRSLYAQCHMGTLAPLDLNQVEGTQYVSVETSKGLLLLECTDKMTDPCANYRAAGSLLTPVVSSGAIKKTQAFARSAVATVVFLVVPFRSSDVKHKIWTIGAFARGLFGTDKIADVQSWRESVTMELVCLDELYEAEVNPSPFVMLPQCFGLYDRVHENVTLKPLDGATSVSSRSRFLCERLYHLADGRAQNGSHVSYIYGGYLVTDDGKWLAWSVTDALGTVLETCMIPIEENEPLEAAVRTMMLKLLNFLALFGIKSVLVVTRLVGVEGASCFEKEEEDAWETLRSNQLKQVLPVALTPLVASVALLQLSVAPYDEVQIRANPSSAILYVSDDVGFAVLPPDERREISRTTFYTGTEAWKSTCLLHAEPCGSEKRETKVVKVVVVHTLLEMEGEKVAMMTILHDLYAQSYLTMHPITRERQSPLPHYLAVLATQSRDYKILRIQVTTDPLQLR